MSFYRFFWDAQSIASIRIEIGATEAASEAAEAAKLATGAAFVALISILMFAINSVSLKTYQDISHCCEHF